MTEEQDESQGFNIMHRDRYIVAWFKRKAAAEAYWKEHQLGFWHTIEPARRPPA